MNSHEETPCHPVKNRLVGGVSRRDISKALLGAPFAGTWGIARQQVGIRKSAANVTNNRLIYSFPPHSYTMLKGQMI